jgi:hypothetical protein
MNQHDIANAQDPDLRASLTAMQRAALLARQTAIQTGTSIVIIQDGQLVHISAEELSSTQSQTNKTSLRGSLNAYADPELMVQEQGAWPATEGKK